MHVPVLLDETMDLLGVRSGGRYVDGTVGSGGHAARMAEAAGPRGWVLGIDRDEEALERTGRRFEREGKKIELARGNFDGMAEMVRDRGMETVDGILLDLGVSSEQLESAGRGFSFSSDGPLDMRMDRTAARTAADLVNELEENELARLIRDYGEERKAGAIARAITRERARGTIESTGHLARIVEKAAGGRRGRVHPCTRTFQALRIAVNDELGALKRGLESGISILGDGGRIAVTSFHSLEDRIVKGFFRAHHGRWESLPQGGQERVGLKPELRIVTRKPLRATREEIERNPRARSAGLRVAERTEVGETH